MTQKYEANLVVIGAGSAGLVSAYIAAAVRAKVILIERCLLYTSPSPRDLSTSRMPSSA